MSKFKISTNYYLDKDRWSSVSSEKLWRQLVNYVEQNKSQFDSVSYHEDQLKINAITSDTTALNENVKLPRNAPQPLKCAMRILKLNTKFDVNSRSLVISTDNKEEFPEYNEVDYETVIIGNEYPSESVFFHESALVNYTNDMTPRDILQNKNVLAIASFKVNIYSIEENNISSTRNEQAFFCYNTETNKIVSSYPLLNEDTYFPVQQFIDHYNDNSSPESNKLTFEKNGVRYEFADVKMAITTFKMFLEADFINFRSFAPASIYEQFIKNVNFIPLWT